MEQVTTKMMNIFEECSGKEINYVELDTLAASFMNTYEVDSLAHTLLLFSGLMIVYGFGLEDSYISEIIEGMDSYNIKLLSIDLFGNAYAHYIGIIKEEYKIKNSSLAKSLDRMLEETQELMEEFEEENKKLDKIIN